MKLSEDGDHYQLSNGRYIYAYGGVIGIGPYDYDISGGWDDPVKHTRKAPHDYESPLLDLTKEEKLEIADFMIAQWQEFKDDILKGKNLK